MAGLLSPCSLLSPAPGLDCRKLRLDESVLSHTFLLLELGSLGTSPGLGAGHWLRGFRGLPLVLLDLPYVAGKAGGWARSSAPFELQTQRKTQMGEILGWALQSFWTSVVEVQETSGSFLCVLQHIAVVCARYHLLTGP